MSSSGDLGVQRGLIIWFLSLHSPSYSFGLSPQKVSGQSSPKKTDPSKARTIAQDPDELPTFGPQANISNYDSRTDGNVSSIDLSSVPPAIACDGPTEPEGNTVASIPPPFTPSIKTTLNKPAIEPGSTPIPLPDGLSVALLKSRLDGKKKIRYALSLNGRELVMKMSRYRGALLTPKEMEDLTESWKPYRSIGKF